MNEIYKEERYLQCESLVLQLFSLSSSSLDFLNILIDILCLMLHIIINYYTSLSSFNNIPRNFFFSDLI